MILYHGSNVEIEDIDFQKCRLYKDFGQGFYLTTLKEQAQKMAQRVARIYGGKPCINQYVFDEWALNDGNISVKIFDAPVKDWALFVINNRNRDYKDISSLECNHDNKYDVVIGPIANDDLALLFRQFSKGFIDVDILVKEMKYKKLTNQYSFHTEKSLSYLKKAGAFYE